MTRSRLTDTKFTSNRCIICKHSKTYPQSETFREDGVLRDSHFYFTKKGAVCEACHDKQKGSE